MDSPIPTATRAIIQLGQHISHTVHRLQQHTPCYHRADQLAEQLQASGHQVAAYPPHLPMADLTPYLIAKHISPALIDAINATGHHAFQNGHRWQINPPADARDGALSFHLTE